MNNFLKQRTDLFIENRDSIKNNFKWDNSMLFPLCASLYTEQDAGHTAVIVKLTRTLFIIPFVLIFSVITERVERKSEGKKVSTRANIKKIFPYFIVFFFIAVVIRSSGILSNNLVLTLSKTSSFFMIMALSAIGLNTNFEDIKNIRYKPMILGFIVDTLVVFVSIGVQMATGRF